MPRTVRKDPHLAPGQPAKPPGLTAKASAEWDGLLGELASANIRVSPAHRTPLELAATIAADIADASAALEKDGAYIVGKAGLVAHPAAKRLDALRRDYIKVLSMLGLRSAVAAPAEVTRKKVDELLNA